MNASQITALAARLAAAAHAYHNGLALTMTDDEFDAGVDQLRAAAPTHPFLAQVGAPITAGDEVALPIPLPSLNKIAPPKAGGYQAAGATGGEIKPDGSLEKWLARFPAASYHVSAKLDGCSALWYPATGRLYTRGDGMRGRDISAFAPHFKGLVRSSSSSSSSTVAIRGELIMRTDSPMIPAGKLARNIVAGALNRKAHEADAALFAEIRFVAYSLEQPADKTPEEAYKCMRAMGFEVARACIVTGAGIDANYLSTVFSTAESKSPYQMDGIVVAPNVARPAGWAPEVRKGASVNPADRVAWKARLTANTATTTVRSVEWNVSHGGMLIPRVLFDQVTLAGANIGAATGLHGRWIFDNKVGPGASIEVRRAGDVIPQIIAVHTPAPTGPAMPASEWIWDGDAATAVHVKPAVGTATTEQDCIQLTHALTELGAENVGPGIVAKLYAAGYTTVGKIYAGTAAEFAARVEGCKEKGAERIWQGLRTKQSSWTELNFLVASCKMPRGVGHSKLKPLLEIQSNPARWAADEFKTVGIAGLSDKTIDAIVAAIPAYIAWRDANGLVSVVAAAPPPAAAAGPQMIVVLTGFRDKDLEASLAAAGHVVADAVSKKTTHVVHPDGPTPTSTKITKAQGQGARILQKSEMLEILGAQ
jgi:DNA ligase (NAD+)